MSTLQAANHGSIHPLAVISGTLELGEGSVVKPGTVIEGHVRIGKNCSIGPNAYLRGFVSIGDNCVVGNAVEVKNSILGCRMIWGPYPFCEYVESKKIWY